MIKTKGLQILLETWCRQSTTVATGPRSSGDEQDRFGINVEGQQGNSSWALGAAYLSAFLSSFLALSEALSGSQSKGTPGFEPGTC